MPTPVRMCCAPLFLSVIFKCKNCAAKLSGKCPIRRHWGAIYDIVLLASVDHDGWFAQQQFAARWDTFRGRKHLHIRYKQQTGWCLRGLDKWLKHRYKNNEVVVHYFPILKPTICSLWYNVLTPAAVFVDGNQTRDSLLSISHTCYLTKQKFHLRYLERR